MNKILIVSVMLCGYIGSASAQKKYHDKANFHQIRAMEDGPWKFEPKGYYYSWFHKRVLGIKIPIPGAGIHDNGPSGIGVGGDHYVKKYGPNAKWRSETIATTTLENSTYENQKKSYSEMEELEVRLSADRTVDLAIKAYNDKYKKLCKQIENNLIEYGKMIQDNREIENLQACTNNYLRIKENMKLISSAYVSNMKRAESYQIELNKLYSLNQNINSLKRMQYNSNVNRCFMGKK